VILALSRYMASLGANLEIRCLKLKGKVALAKPFHGNFMGELCNNGVAVDAPQPWHQPCWSKVRSTRPN